MTNGDPAARSVAATAVVVDARVVGAGRGGSWGSGAAAAAAGEVNEKADHACTGVEVSSVVNGVMPDTDSDNKSGSERVATAAGVVVVEGGEISAAPTRATAAGGNRGRDGGNKRLGGARKWGATGGT